ncbi:CHASE2 domain-containing protein [Croceicoccus bisphenolivorans]|uniref:CHASE2 domain-containing protein n=1 Tax=Croceicoccus bisphenolivorans TaxID=1783232 RepID=UPI00083701E1|nr:adenylate/guanylate cyclase domain-containing protein [Croceicoccus bisphenolivorans]
MAAHYARLKRFGPALAGVATLAFIVLLQFADPAPLQRVRMQVFDFYQIASPRLAAEDRVTIVDIDEDSIARLGQWPWPRTDLAELTRRLGNAGAVVIAYDIVFSEPDRTSISQVATRYERLGYGNTLADLAAKVPDNDALLAESFAKAPVVTGFFLDRNKRGRNFEPKTGFTLHGSLPTAKVNSYEGALLPLPGLEAAATGNGFVSLEGDADGLVRRVPLVAIHRDKLIPALSLEAVRIARSAGSPSLMTSDGSGETASAPGSAVAVRIGGVEVPVTDRGEMWVHFPPPESQRMLPAWPIITGAMSDDDLAKAVRGKIVFVGGSAAGLQDLVSTPTQKLIAGVTVHAAAAEQMLGGDFLERPDWAFGLELVLTLLLGGSLALVLPRLGAAWGALSALLGIAAVAAGSWAAFTQASYLLDPTYPILSLVMVYIVQTVAVFYREERQRRYIHSAFDRYLSPEMVRRIAADPDKLELGGEEREMTVLMCDIRGFSRISEGYSPKALISFLIDFLTPLSDILLARKATIDKYIGDAVLAFWNAPLDDPDQHENAARAALEMIANTAELNRTMPAVEGAAWPGNVRIGIGLNSGVCCVGNMGSRQRLSYTLIGDTVNLASRLEGLTKQYGVPIIAGYALAEHLTEFALLEIDYVRVVGRDAPERIFALLGDELVRGQPDFERLARVHGSIIAAYREQRWDDGLAAINRSAADYAAFEIGGLRNLYLDRITALRTDPPADDWDGIFVATLK